jgi:Sporulation and spore germination
MLLAACNTTFEIGIEHSPQTEATAIVPPSPTVVVIPPSPTLPSPTATSAPTATLAPSDTPSGPQFVQIYLIAMEDNGVSGPLIGCGDSAVPVQVEIPHTQGTLRAALESLLSIKAQYYGGSGLYNALYQSDLQVESVKIENGKATVNLTGTMMMGGECDIPRVQAQLELTVRQFPTVSEMDIFINGRPLADVLSLK